MQSSGNLLTYLGFVAVISLTQLKVFNSVFAGYT